MHVRPLLWSGIGFSSMSEALRTSSAPQIGPKAPTRLPRLREPGISGPISRLGCSFMPLRHA